MHAATFNLELKSALRQDGTQAIRIRITKYREHAYWNVGRYVLKSEWNKAPKRRLKNWVLKNRMAPQINDAIEVALSGLEEAADKNPGLTAAKIKEAYSKSLAPESEAAPVSFWEYAETFIARAKETSYNTGKNYHYLIKEYKAIVGEATPYADLFSDANARKFLKALKAKGNGPVTVSNKIMDLRKVYAAGVKEKALPPLPEKPFAHLKLTVPKQKKIRPTAEQVKQILSHQPVNKVQAIAKTVATLQYLLQGARVTEALTLEWANVQANYIEYLPLKTAGKPKFVPHSKLLNKLLEGLPREGRYVLPYIGEDYHSLTLARKLTRKNYIIRQVNQGLREIGTKLEIPFRLTSHMMRHAFADAIIATGSSVHVAAALLGHSNPSTTEQYIKDLQLEDISETALSIFDKLEGE